MAEAMGFAPLDQTSCLLPSGELDLLKGVNVQSLGLQS